MWYACLYLLTATFALYALIGWALWFTGNLWVLAGIVVSPSLWTHISSKNKDKDKKED